LLYFDKYSKRFCNRADARGNDMSERLQARAISPGKHARSKSQDPYQKDQFFITYNFKLTMLLTL
uniref:hypothetical protein n=1 Tax=Paenibacillus xylanexedens TaxID=528191 RepID=UPI001C92D92A